MIDALIGGKLHAKPLERTGQSGRPFVTAKVIAINGGGEPLLVNVIAFSGSARGALLALDAGDSVSIAGPLTPKAYAHEGVSKPSLDITAQHVLTAYHVTRKRRDVASEETPA